MKVLILKQDHILEFLLPQKIYGDYWILDDHQDNLINVHEVDHQWQLDANDHVKIMVDGVYQNSIILKEDVFCYLEVAGNPQPLLLYCTPTYDTTYCLFMLKGTSELLIGSSDNCDIVYRSKLLGAEPIKLTYQNQQFIVDNFKSSTLLYVNQEVCQVKPLKNGDIIFLMGLKMIILGSYILVNNPQGLRSCSLVHLEEYRIPEIKEIPEGEEELELYEKSEYFFRSPRLRNKVVPQTINIDPPPQAPQDEDMPLILSMGSMLTMGMSSLISCYTAVNNLKEGADPSKTLPSLILAGSMIVGMIFFPLISNRYQKHRKKKKEKYRQKKYSQYIDQKRKDILQIIKEQQEVMNANSIPIEKCYELVMKRNRNLWERKIEHDDFLCLRLGMGSLPAELEINYPEEHFTLDDDNLRANLYKLAEEPKELVNVPIRLSLTEKFVAAVLGERSLTQKFVESLLIQMTSFHSYDDLKIVVFTNDENVEKWDYLKVLPHTWSNNRSVRFFGSNSDDISQLSIYLMSEFMHRKFQDEDAMVRTKTMDYKGYQPYYLILVDDFMSVRNFDIIKSVLSQQINYGFSLVILANKLNELPNECNTFINIEKEKSGIIENELMGDKQHIFQADFNESIPMNQYVRLLANIPVELSKNRFDLPAALSFLEMYGVGKVEQLNALARWSNSNTTTTLQAPVGVDENGELFKLDLHEKAHGPHGLVAGMTGSGKSEFIITYILSMAVNYHPDEVAFVLIDYKGGGLAGAFENKETGVRLPHLVGTITNLDSVEIKRNLSSIESELRRRQRIFNETRNKLNESTIDIYKYQKLYKAGKVTEPVPHLMIISDEFAELKVQEPEFMAQLISTARIGRSLGVHLILATQKPSGVVDDQIWSNSKFRVCLKVQDKSDSMDMIKCPDAASLTNVGRFYLQVGYNEFFALGQSAWCGAPYYESNVRKKKVDLSLNFVDEIGAVIKSVDREKTAEMAVFKGEELPNIISYLQELARDEKIELARLWLERIPNEIFVEKLRKKYHYRKEKFMINPIIGEYDDPSNQKQHLLTLPLSLEGNTLIYGTAGSGKENLLSTILYATATSYTPEEANFYVLDFGSETMRNFSGIPHIGDVILSNEKEKVENLFKLLLSMVEERKKLFVLYNGNHYAYCKNSGKTVPVVIVIVNNYEAFNELYPEYDDVLGQLTREGSKYGILFVLTVSGVNAVRYKLSQNFRQQLVLQLNDKYDYVSVLGDVSGTYPSKSFGRGIIKLENIVYEFQSALAYKKESLNVYMKAIAIKLREKYTIFAPKVPILPEQVSLSFLADRLHTLRDMPIGVRKDTLEIESYDFESRTVTNIMAYDYDSMVRFVSTFVAALSKLNGVSLTVLDGIKMLEKYHYANTNYYSKQFDEVLKQIQTYVDDLFMKAEQADFQDSFLRQIHPNVVILIGVGMIKDRISTFNDLVFDLFSKSKKLANTLFVLIDTVDNFKKSEFDAWYKSNVDNNFGIWVGNGISTQYTLKLSKTPRELSEDIPSDFGYSVKNGIPSLVKLLDEDILVSQDEIVEEIDSL